MRPPVQQRRARCVRKPSSLNQGLEKSEQAGSIAVASMIGAVMPRGFLMRISMLSLLCAAALTAQTSQSPAKSGQPLPVQGRSIITTKYGIVAASQPVAAASGVQILERGGNAVDAAIATNAVIGLMEPMSNGIGGDLFAIIYEAKTGKLYGLNSSGWAAKAETPELLASKGITAMPERGVWTVTVSGTVGRMGGNARTVWHE